MATVSEPATMAESIFAGTGELRTLCRELDWDATPLGAVEHWSPTLCTAAQMVLASGIPSIVLWGPQLIQIYNDAYATLIGAKHPRALGRGNQELWPEVWHINGPIYERVFAGETVTLADALYRLERTESGPGVGEDAYLTISYSPILDRKGGVGGVLVVMMETTTVVQRRAMEEERERLLAALQLEQDRLAAVFEQAPTFLAVLQGPDHVFSRVNDAYLQLIGHRDIIGKPISEALPEAAEQGLISLLDSVFATGEPFIGRGVRIMVHRPGAPAEEHFLDFIYQPMRELEKFGVNRITAVVAHGSDVTEQVTATHAVERARERATRLQKLTAALAATTTPADAAEVVVAQGASATGATTGMLCLRAPVLAASDEAAFVVVRQLGLDGMVHAGGRRYALNVPGPAAQCMRTGAEIFCESREEVVTCYPEMVEEWTRLGTHALVTLPLLVTGRIAGVMSFTFREPRRFPAEERAFFLSLAGQSARALERAWLFAAEQESHRRAEEALAAAETARQRAEVANRARAEFLGVISHELRTPLNAIGGYTELLELGVHGPVTPEQSQALGRIQTSQRHLLGLINSVLNYTRVEAGAVHYDVEAVPLHEVLSTCQALIAPQVLARGLQLNHPACDESLRALADREKIQQIVLNLLSNSVKFTTSGGQVEVSCAATSDQVMMHVADTGRGIAPDQLEQVFQPFVQVDSKLTRTQEGVGLGLSISRDLARAMGGDLTAESAVGVGSIFTLTLPRAS